MHEILLFLHKFPSYETFPCVVYSESKHKLKCFNLLFVGWQPSLGLPRLELSPSLSHGGQTALNKFS